MIDFITEIFTNLPLVSALIAMFAAQFIKIIYYYFVDREIDLWHFLEAGGMPSSHSALVCALSTMVGLVNGWDSVLFAISLVLSIIVMYDAAGVRRAAGKQAIILNKIVEDIYTSGKVSEEKLKELMGHTPLEVMVGALLGVGISLYIYFFIIF